MQTIKQSMSGQLIMLCQATVLSRCDGPVFVLVKITVRAENHTIFLMHNVLVLANLPNVFVRIVLVLIVCFVWWYFD